MPKSLRKFIRKEKARIRREFLDTKEQDKLILGLYKKVLKDELISRFLNDNIGESYLILSP